MTNKQLKEHFEDDNIRAVMYKDGKYVFVEKPSGKKVRYDLSEGNLARPKDGGWKNVQHQYHFFSSLNFDTIKFVDDTKKFEELMNYVRRGENVTSVSTFLSRIHKYLILEPYIQAGADFEFRVRRYRGRSNVRTVRKPLSWYDKYISDFFVENGVTFTRGLEDKYEDNKNLLKKIVGHMKKENYTPDQLNSFIKLFTGYSLNTFCQLINEYNYEPKALVGYLLGYLEPFEGLSPRSSVSTLRDYYSMASEMGRSVDKYPKYLRSMHDIINANYQTFKKEHDKEKFQEVAMEFKKFEFEGDEYSVLAPEDPDEIIREGTELSHCVSSYVDRIIGRQTMIVFMRKTKTPENPLVTVEIRGDAIVQAKGARNRSLLQDEKKFLKKYAKKTELKPSAI